MKTFDTFYSEYRDRLNSSVQEIASEMSGGPYSPSEFAGKLIVANQMVTLDTLRMYHQWLSEQSEEQSLFLLKNL